MHCTWLIFMKVGTQWNESRDEIYGARAFYKLTKVYDYLLKVER